MQRVELSPATSDPSPTIGKIFRVDDRDNLKEILESSEIEGQHLTPDQYLGFVVIEPGNQSSKCLGILKHTRTAGTRDVDLGESQQLEQSQNAFLYTTNQPPERYPSEALLREAVRAEARHQSESYDCDLWALLDPMGCGFDAPNRYSTIRKEISTESNPPKSALDVQSKTLLSSRQRNHRNPTPSRLPKLDYLTVFTVHHNTPLVHVAQINEKFIGRFYRTFEEVRAASKLEKAMKTRSFADVQQLVGIDFDLVATGATRWLKELHELGYSREELTEILVEKARDSPWIYFEPLEMTRAPVNPSGHIPRCAHESKSGSPNSIQYTPEFSHFSTRNFGRTVTLPEEIPPRLLVSSAEWPPNTTDEFVESAEEFVRSASGRHRRLPHTVHPLGSVIQRGLCAMYRALRPDSVSHPRSTRLRSGTLTEYKPPKAGKSEEIAMQIRELPIPPEGNVMHHLVAALCGLGGVAPTSRDQEDWVGNVSFDETGHKKKSKPASISYGPGSLQQIPEILCATSRIRRAVDSFCETAGRLQAAEMCCHCFTIIIRNPEKKGQIELHRVEFEVAKKLLGVLQSLDQGQNFEAIQDSCYEASLSVLYQVCGTSTAFHPETLKWFHEERSCQKVLHICAVAAQMLCLGLLSYSQAHVGPLQPFFLDTPVEEVCLLGVTLDEAKLHVKVQLQRLTCMQNMLRNRVLVFDFSSGCKRHECLTSFDIHPEKIRFSSSRETPMDIISSTEDVLDTWGPGYTVLAPSESTYDRNAKEILCAVRIGGGTIMETIGEEANGRFHWYPSTIITTASLKSFDAKEKIQIGTAIAQNELCRPDEAYRWKWSDSILGNLGTFCAKWRQIERQCGLSGGQYLSLNLVNVWSKVSGQTLKDIQLSHACWPSYQFLQGPWGAQISFCTGVAMRVPLRTLIADVIPAYMKSLILYPSEWKTLRRENFVDALRDSSVDLQEWFERRNNSEALQDSAMCIIRSVLDILRHTGMNEHGEFVAAWILPGKAFKRFNIPCKDQSFWMKALADSEDCATFACVTSKCLEAPGHTCRGAKATWKNKVFPFETAVSSHMTIQTGLEATVELKDGEIYSIGKPEFQLRAIVSARNTAEDPRLSIYKGHEPREIWHRVRGRLGDRRRLRERQDIDSPAQDVLFFGGKGN